MSESADAAEPLSDIAIDAVAWLRRFEAEHGDATAVIAHLGRRGARIVVVANNGIFGDAVVPSVEQARQVCERAGVVVGTWDRETSAKVDLSPADRIRMAGTGR